MPSPCWSVSAGGGATPTRPPPMPTVDDLHAMTKVEISDLIATLKEWT